MSVRNSQDSSENKVPDCRSCPVRHRSLMRDLEETLLGELNDSKHCNIYMKGDTIFREGNNPMGLFAIYSGKVKVYKTGEQGKEQIIRMAKAGDPIGYRSLISSESYMASAEVLETSRICFIPKSVFKNLMQTSNKLYARIIQVLSEDLKVAEDRVAAMATKSVRERTAEAILMLHNYYGTEADGKTMAITLSREDLANLVGTATESLIRMLSEFKNDKMIELKDKKITVTDLKKLERTANIAD